MTEYWVLEFHIFNELNVLSWIFEEVYYSLRKYKKKGFYDVMTDMSENVTLVQLMDSLGNVNHAISVVGYRIFDSNYKKALVLNRESLDMICAPSVSE